MKIKNELLFDNTESLKFKCDNGLITIPAIKAGKENRIFSVGDTVKTKASSNRKQGSTGEIETCYSQNGYWFYEIEGLGVQRQKDIEGILK